MSGTRLHIGRRRLTLIQPNLRDGVHDVARAKSGMISVIIIGKIGVIFFSPL